MQFDSLEIQKIVEEKRLIWGQKLEKFLLKKLAKIPPFFGRIFAAKKTALFGAIFVISVSILCQSMRDLGHDSATYPEIAQKMLLGGKYFEDFFEPNLPLNFLLTMIPILIAQKFDFNIFATAQIFWNLLGILSIFWSAKILTRSLLLRDKTVFNLVFLSLVAGFFWRVFTLQFNEFGTKTTYLLAVLIPYISCHLIDEKDWRKSDQIFAGILAALLFCLKPHYGIFAIIFELQKLIKSRNFLSIFCLRNYVTLALLCGYFAVIIKFFPSYINHIQDVSSSYFGDGVSMIFFMFLWDISPLLLLLVLCADLIKKEKILLSFLWPISAATLLILSEFIGALDQRFIFYSTSLPLIILLVFFLIKNRSINWNRDYLFIVPILLLPQFDPQSIFSLAIYIPCFWWVFALFFFKKIHINKLTKIFLGLIGLVTIFLLAKNEFNQFFWFISLLIFIFVARLELKFHQKISTKKEFSTLSASLIFVVLSYFLSLHLSSIFNFRSYYNFYKFSSPNHFNSEVIKTIRHNSRKDEEVTFVTTGIPGTYPAINYAGKKNELPFLQNGFLFKQIGSEKKLNGIVGEYMLERLKQQIALQKNKLVFVEIMYNAKRDRCTIGFLENYFSDEEFREIFLENYVFLTRIKSFIEIAPSQQIIDHEFEVYLRK